MTCLDCGTHAYIPDKIRALNSEGMTTVGETGKDGALLLVFQRNDAGRTVIAEQFSEVPLHVQKAMYYDDLCPNMAYTYIISASGGILQGDRYKMGITMKGNSMAHITTQGATRIYSMNTNSAMQLVNITLEENSYLEFIPDQVIPYRGSRFYQEANLNVHDSATMVYSEIITPGRVARGELFEYDICRIRTKAVNQENEPRFTDTVNIEPKKRQPASSGVLGGHTVMGSVYIATRKENVQELLKRIRAAMPAGDGTVGGASTTKDGRGVIARILGCETEIVMGLILEIAGHARHVCTGYAFPTIRKN